MKMAKRLLVLTCLLITVCTAVFAGDTTRAAVAGPMPVDDSAFITVPNGFKAVMTANLGAHARHLVVAADGDVFVKTDRPKGGKGVFRLRDTNGDGKADDITGFGNYGGTGIAIKDGYLYSASNTEVFRYKINEKTGVVDTNSVQKIVTGLISKGQHNTKSIALDNNGNIYVIIGAPSNSCQLQDRTPGSPGQDPCPLLEQTGGVWQFKVDKLNQSYAEGVRYATGIRNIVGIDWNNQVNQLYVMQHGRDQLSTLFPDMYTNEQSAELPAEELLMVRNGSNFGWPYCYYDQFQKKKILAPEYGGDGKKQGRCEKVDTPLMAFPGHWAPNGLLFYTGSQFPAHYKNGAFIAFHGSWNRAPLKQGGYFVAFVPFKDGKPSGNWEVFAENFAGKEIYNPRDAKYRPCGLAQGPDGSLYISDDVKGAVWKITYGK